MTSLTARLRGDGLQLDFGAACARLRVPAEIPALTNALERVYQSFTPIDTPVFCAVDVLVRPLGPRIAPSSCELIVDSERLFDPFPIATHLPILEWGINFLLAQRLMHVLLLHAGVVARDDRAVVMPAMPGSGKSTLTAALMNRGFRLLSDEFGVVDLGTGQLLPMVRPVGLKNASIDVIHAFAPDAVLGPSFGGTRKGTVAHVAPDAIAVANCHRSARPALIAFPQYSPNASLAEDPVPRSFAFNRLAINAFNYTMLGISAFRAVKRLVNGCRCISLRYGALDDAIGAIERMLDDTSD